MNELQEQFKRLFKRYNITIPDNRKHLFNKFILNEENVAVLNEISQNENRLMAKWKLEDSIAEIMQKPIRLLNATVGKPFETKFDFDKFGWKNITMYEFTGLEETGLRYDQNTKQLTGIPSKSGDTKVVFKFKVKGQPDAEPFNEKVLTLIINPDPKSLWKALESDQKDPYWKPDDSTVFAGLADRHILVSSKRGRSHANIGSFREDDYAFRDLDNGWSIVVVSDGAGSAKFSRHGSTIACNQIVDYFLNKSSKESLIEFDKLLHDYTVAGGDDRENKIKLFVYNNLGKGVFEVHKTIENFAHANGLTLKDLSCTLAFTLFKKYDTGYAMLSFGVGDCPMAVLNKDISEVTLLNWIDVGEFGGGTRFITMPEIFQSDKFASRFGFKLVEEFSYLFLMSDGIYDPKFIVESNLPDIEKWKTFLADLGGENESNDKVDLEIDNKNIENQLSAWMNFWSIGNHDDRTLAIVF